MCGFISIIGPDKNLNISQLIKMRDTLTHRGPDGEGHWIKEYKNGCIMMGFRRLSILDKRHVANQPMQVNRLLNDGYFVTIDYQYAIHNEVKKRYSGVWQHEKFIPFCSVIFENSEEDKKLCFKIDDVDFNTSNKGVWTMNMEDFKKHAGYTTWEEYKQDKPIEERDIWPTVVSAQSS